MSGSVWKPLVGPVENWPLAVCDRSSIKQAEDIVIHDAVFAESLVETGELLFSDRHKFFYLSDQRVDEGLVILQTDSVTGHGQSHLRSRIKCSGLQCLGTPHASFELPEASKLHKTRESIEIRTLVFY